MLADLHWSGIWSLIWSNRGFTLYDQLLRLATRTDLYKLLPANLNVCTVHPEWSLLLSKFKSVRTVSVVRLLTDGSFWTTFWLTVSSARLWIAKLSFYVIIYLQSCRYPYAVNDSRYHSCTTKMMHFHSLNENPPTKLDSNNLSSDVATPNLRNESAWKTRSLPTFITL